MGRHISCKTNGLNIVGLMSNFQFITVYSCPNLAPSPSRTVTESSSTTPWTIFDKQPSPNFSPPQGPISHYLKLALAILLLSNPLKQRLELLTSRYWLEKKSCSDLLLPIWKLIVQSGPISISSIKYETRQLRGWA